MLDIEGNQRAVIDALDRVVMRYDYDMVGTRIHQASMEAGERWMLNDVGGKPVRAWNSRGFAFRTEYDASASAGAVVRAGRRQGEALPTKSCSSERFTATAPRPGFPRRSASRPICAAKSFRHFDGAGVVTTDRYDFKGNPLRSARQFARDYAGARLVAAQPLESRPFRARRHTTRSTERSP